MALPDPGLKELAGILSRGSPLSKVLLDWFRSLSGTQTTVTTTTTNVTALTTRVTAAEADIDALQDDVAEVAVHPPAYAEPYANTQAPGVIEIATQAEVDAGTDTKRAVTPATLAAWSGFGDLPSWVPLTDGAEPPSLISDGAGGLIFVSYTP